MLLGRNPAVDLELLLDASDCPLRDKTPRIEFLQTERSEELVPPNLLLELFLRFLPHFAILGSGARPGSALRGAGLAKPLSLCSELPSLGGKTKLLWLYINFVCFYRRK